MFEIYLNLKQDLGTSLEEKYYLKIATLDFSQFTKHVDKTCHLPMTKKDNIINDIIQIKPDSV